MLLSDNIPTIPIFTSCTFHAIPTFSIQKYENAEMKIPAQNLEVF